MVLHVSMKSVRVKCDHPDVVAYAKRGAEGGTEELTKRWCSMAETASTLSKVSVEVNQSPEGCVFVCGTLKRRNLCWFVATPRDIGQPRVTLHNGSNVASDLTRISPNLEQSLQQVHAAAQMAAPRVFVKSRPARRASMWLKETGSRGGRREEGGASLETPFFVRLKRAAPCQGALLIACQSWRPASQEPTVPPATCPAPYEEIKNGKKALARRHSVRLGNIVQVTEVVEAQKAGAIVAASALVNGGHNDVLPT